MRKIFLIVCIIILLLSSLTFADENKVVSLGKDLTLKQRDEILDLFKAKEDIKVIYVTNDEEVKYLGKFVQKSVIGTKAISCAYVEKLGDNGIEVEAYNISYITKEMYKNALVTAGIKDAKIKVAAPFEVSGTAALTGIIKAFEDVSNKNISEEKKNIANKEIANTYNLSKKVGKKEASNLVRVIKERVIDKNLKKEEDIKRVVIEISNDLDISLSEKEINNIVDLMKDISKLNLNINEIKKQLKGVSDKLNELNEDNEEVKSILNKILDILRELFAFLTDLFTNSD
ncbi:MAG: DUF1002 domain-containing protein [Firmicutes bacterium]|nr:DUF1002 domain-containing protein [Bacillota bacterium]